MMMMKMIGSFKTSYSKSSSMSWKPISNIENIDQANKGTSEGINCLVRCASCALFLPQLKFYDN